MIFTKVKCKIKTQICCRAIYYNGVTIDSVFLKTTQRQMHITVKQLLMISQICMVKKLYMACIIDVERVVTPIFYIKMSQSRVSAIQITRIGIWVVFNESITVITAMDCNNIGLGQGLSALPYADPFKQHRQAYTCKPVPFVIFICLLLLMNS